MEKEGKQVVLIVDDSILVCEQIKASLEDLDIFICEAHSGQEALDAARQYQPDLILLDVILPDAEGYDLCKGLKEVNRNEAWVVFLTSKDTEEDVIKGFDAGGNDYVKKPFIKGELKSRICAHLQLKKNRDELRKQNEELRTSMEKLNDMAFRDGLTGLYNRRYVIGDLLEDIRNKHDKNRKNIMILADIDDFKKVNDTYGHDAGDMALVCIANIIDGQCYKHRVIRWGGEEFLIVLLSVTEDEAFEISESIRKEVESFKIYHEDVEFSCTLTLGLHAFHDEEGIEESINRADKALYAGKRSGKNCSKWFEAI